MGATAYTCRLRALLEMWSSRLMSLDDEAASRRPSPERWSPKEIIGHLIDSASNNHQRFVRAQSQSSLTFLGYEQDGWVAAQDYQRAPWSELVALWSLFNLHLARVMEATPDEERMRAREDHNLDHIGWQPFRADEAATLDAFMADYVGHLAHHLDQIPQVRSPGPPARIETERLVVRRWQDSDAPLLRHAIDTSLDHLRPWLPWAETEPVSLQETRRRLAIFQAKSEVGDDFYFGLFDAGESRVLGAAGLHTRQGPGVLEIGYWVRADSVNQGFATEAARALTQHGLEVEGIDRIEIRCNPANVASRRVPERLGFRLAETIEGEDRDTLVYAVTAEGWRLLRTDHGLAGR